MFKEQKNKVQTIIKTGDESDQRRLSGFQRLRECCFILGSLIAIFLAISLYSFSPADPSWSQTSWGGEVNNASGILGAWIADTLFFAFGSLAYCVPIVIAAFTWGLFRRREDDDSIDLMLWGTRILGLSLVILTSCGLADINFDDIWYFSSGGVIGDVLTSLSLPILNLLGTTIVFLFLWGAGLTLLTGISWLSIVEWLGSRFIGALTWVLNTLRGSPKETLQSVNNDQVEETTSEEELAIDTPFEHRLESDNEQDNPQRRYNIHIPKENQEASVSRTNEEASDVERSQQLYSTIEQLEQDAQQHNDMPIVTQNINLRDDEFTSHRMEITNRVEPSESDIEHVVNEAEKNEPSISREALDHLIDDEFAEKSRVSEVLEIDDNSEQDRVQTTIGEESNTVEETRTDIQGNVVEEEQGDEDVKAFQDLVSEAQQNMAAEQNPFLVQKQANLPVPTAPLPTLELLYHPEKRENHIDRAALEEIARLVESKLDDYKIKARVVDIFPGPVITRFELDLAPGVKVSRISSLSMDLARSLSAMAVRVVEVIPGKPYVGLELPNITRQTVYFSDVVNSKIFQESTSPTTVVMGQDIAGEAVIADIAKMPHVLVAGTTGSGKSVGVNVMILSMLYKAKPEDLRFIMIDPKMLELSIYEGIPHLLSEVVTDMKDAANALRWCVGEMERRYKLMSALGVRNIKGFNEKLKMAADAGHPIHDPLWKAGDSMDQVAPLLEKLPYIVVVVDEFADLIMVVGKKVEELIARLAQKARAAGVHLILATQRPSVDVITGLIKANIPTRVAFTVSTKTDSRTILDQGGAESLLGMGDMLYLPPGSSHTTRVHGAFASDDDVHAVVNDWKARGQPNYIDEIVNGQQTADTLLPGENMDSDEDVDPLFDQVVEHVVQSRRGSVSGVQRRFKIGYNRAARIIEQLEAQGIVSSPGHNGNREVLAPAPVKE
ncbi:DNA translocase FtsK 4TM domain-containing protein [Vibrio sp. VB16]|uniref:DNA translocase FtsK 4TM domain-containing protein n=1 Tax=Vibrio sp. VB16 TaxID=2785746 RepID=UPI00189D19A8|nr:DNA translocase FtsK 4TM domain-containing protein [Vibrio sp. VB16]UGA55824.1 DNA translocase FtsK 4TM domain-containing protein [Vibrio sp. VB16]